MMKIKKLSISLVVCVCFIFNYCFTTANAIRTEDVIQINNIVETNTKKIANLNELVDIPAKSAILIEQSTGKILFEKNSNEKLPPASITKIMTLLIVMENLDNGQITLNDMVTGSEHSSSMGGSQIWLEPGEQMSVNDLVKATAVASANDAAVALAEFIAGSEQAFVQLMNQKADELGMVNTNFVNASGLDADGHITTANDIALMSKELLNYEKIIDYSTIWMDSLRNGDTELVNTNRLVRFYKGATGLKTGTTDGAGSCLAASASRNNLSLIAVTMGSDTSKDRFSAAETLLDYGFASYEMYIPEYRENIDPIRVVGGVEDRIDLEVVMPETGIVIKKGSAVNLKQNLSITQDIQAPVQKGQTVGKIVISLDEQVLYEIEVKTKDKVDKINIFSAFFKLMNNLFE